MEYITRRRALQLGVTSAGAILAGCSRASTGDPSTKPIQNPVPEFALLSDDIESDIGVAADADLAYQFGSGDTSHQFLAFAETPGSLETHFSVRRPHERVFWEETAELSHTDYALIDFVYPSTYIIEIETYNHFAEVVIPEDAIDCNQSLTGLVLQIDGGVERGGTIPDNGCG